MNLSTDQQSLPASAAIEPLQPFDYSYTHDGIKESFLSFSFKIYQLDKEFGRFKKECMQLGRAAGLLLAIRSVREMLERTREAFFRNAIALYPDLFELARKDGSLSAHDLISERYFVGSQFFLDRLPPFDVLPRVLEDLAQAFRRLHNRFAEFRESTDEGLLIKSLLLALHKDLLYRASCVRVYSDRLNTPLIQRYIHQFTDELGRDIQKLSDVLPEFAAVGIPAIVHEQERSSQNLGNMLTASTFFSAVAASTLQMSNSTSPQSGGLQLASMLWFTSLVFSVGAALNRLLAMAWKDTHSNSRGGNLPYWITMWLDGSQLIFLGSSIVTFAAGLVVFAYASNQAVYTPVVTAAVTGVTFFGLFSGLIWITYEEWRKIPVLRLPAGAIKSSRESVHSDDSKLAFRYDLAGVLANALASARRHPYNDQANDDIEKVEKITAAELSPQQEDSRGGKLAQKFQKNVKGVALLGSAVSAFISTRHIRRREPPLSRNKQNDKTVSPAPMTQLVLPSQPKVAIELTRYGTIRDVAYSEDGQWLAVTCASETTAQSWTGIYEGSTMAPVADIWHRGSVISERLIWSPSRQKLIIKFDRRFDVWDLVTKNVHPNESYRRIQDVAWCGDDAFLVADNSCVFKMNLDRLMAIYRFSGMHLRSFAFERESNHLIVVARVAKSPEQFEPASVLSEKQIIVYDMDIQEIVYRVPVLENISNIKLVADELDMLVTHKDQEAFQLWTLDSNSKGTEIIPRTFTPPANKGTYVGPASIVGNYSQFVLSATSSGAVDIWHRESGMPHQHFETQLFQEEGLRCFSWKKSNDNMAVFATAGVDSSILRIWQGEEPVMEMPSIPDRNSIHAARQKGSTAMGGRGHWKKIINAAISSTPSRETEKVDKFSPVSESAVGAKPP